MHEGVTVNELTWPLSCPEGSDLGAHRHCWSAERWPAIILRIILTVSKRTGSLSAPACIIILTLIAFSKLFLDYTLLSSVVLGHA